MTLSTYVNFVLPIAVLALGLGVAGVNHAVRRRRRSRPSNRTRAKVDTSGLLSHRRL